MEKGAISLQFLELCPVPVHTKAPCEFIEIARSGKHHQQAELYLFSSTSKFKATELLGKTNRKWSLTDYTSISDKRPYIC